MAYKLKPFYGARISFFGFSEEEKQHMKDILVDNEGTYVEMSDPSCTHVVGFSGINIFK